MAMRVALPKPIIKPQEIENHLFGKANACSGWKCDNPTYIVIPTVINIMAHNMIVRVPTNLILL